MKRGRVPKALRKNQTLVKLFKAIGYGKESEAEEPAEGKPKKRKASKKKIQEPQAREEIKEEEGELVRTVKLLKKLGFVPPLDVWNMTKRARASAGVMRFPIFEEIVS